MRKLLVLTLLLAALPAFPQEVRTYEQMSDEMSKTGIERLFEANLSDWVFAYSPAAQWSPEGAVRLSGDVWIVSKGRYEEDNCRNAAFYRKAADGTMTPLFDPEMPEETVRTLCTLDCGRDITANLTFNRYGYKTDHAQCPVGAMVSFCLNEGCVPYVQMDKVEADIVVATLLMVNAPAGYNHVFKVEVPRTVLSGETAEIGMTLNAYVPTHNLKDLHADK